MAVSNLSTDELKELINDDENLEVHVNAVVCFHFSTQRRHPSNVDKHTFSNSIEFNLKIFLLVCCRANAHFSISNCS